MTTSSYDPGFNPVYDPDTPPAAEAKLEAFRDGLDAAREALRQARDAELAAKEARDAAKRKWTLSSECPKPGVFDGVRVTVAYVQAWIEDKIAGEEQAYQVMKLARQAASEHLRTLGKQGSYQQTLTSSVREAYRGSGGSAWLRTRVSWRSAIAGRRCSRRR